MLGCGRCSWRMLLLAADFPAAITSSTPAAGDLVWANDRSTACWWPCEKLDPLAMPAGAGPLWTLQRGMPLGLCRSLLLLAGWLAACWSKMHRLAKSLTCCASDAGRDLPPGAIKALSAVEKLASLPQYRQLATKLTAEQVCSWRDPCPVQHQSWRPAVAEPVLPLL